MELKLAFIGFGNVARAFARMLSARRTVLERDYKISWRTTAISTARHGSVLASRGIDLEEAVRCVERGGDLTSLPNVSALDDAAQTIESCDADILFETTPLDPIVGEPAIAYIRAALSRGINVVTANKGPIAFAYRELKAMADERGSAFRFEGTVMDGTPVFNMAEHCLPACRITGFYGVLNSTTNLILTQMERGLSFDESLEEARRIGVAEANADHDIDGYDAAVKAVALANVLMKADARPRDVERRGIREITTDELKSAAEGGCAIRLVARAAQTSEGLKLKVWPERLPLASPLASVEGTTNVLVIQTDLMGEIAIFETDPGVEQTAYGLLSDMVKVHESLTRLSQSGK